MNEEVSSVRCMTTAVRPIVVFMLHSPPLIENFYKGSAYYAIYVFKFMLKIGKSYKGYKHLKYSQLQSKCN